jgi:outer membrane protein
MDRRRRDDDVRGPTAKAAGEAPLLGRAALGALVLLALAATTLVAQAPPGTLTLEEAIRLARDHNPGFQSTRNDRSAADWGVREAYSAFLPTASADFSAGYTEAGTQRIGTLDFGAQGTDWYSSTYNLNLSWTLSGSTVFGVPAARAGQRAVDARIDAAAFDLESQVALQYMAVLRGRDGVEVARRRVERAGQNLRIVRSRVSSGAAAGTEGKQAEVDLGRAEVGLIRAERDYREARALLAEQLGVPLEESVVLSSEFSVFEPDWELPALMEQALGDHPSVQAFQAQEVAAKASARQAASRYFPSFSVFTGLRGNTLQALNEEFIVSQEQGFWESRQSSCEFNNALIQGVSTVQGQIQDCSRFAFTSERQQAALAQNASFPFDFTRLPVSVTFQVSIPVFTGFSRQRQVAEAHNVADDARYALRAEELRLRTEVTRAYDNLEAAYEVVRLEERNRALAREQLQLQQRRYAMGAASLLELLDAQTTLSTAEQQYLNALYDFHWNLIRLEAAVGRGLRPERP